MVPALLVATLLFMAPWLPGDLQDEPAGRLPPPAAAGRPAQIGSSFDPSGAARKVAEGAAARLASRGTVVQLDREGASLLLPSLEAGADGPVVLSVEFGQAATPWASGTETRFGGGGEDPWRLASRVRGRLISGFRDVLGYRAYDRGAVEWTGPAPGAGVMGENEWVEARPLFASNPEERALLEWPETLDLISAALADAVNDYLDPSQPALPWTSSEGWVSTPSPRPVTPRTVYRGGAGPGVALTFDGGASSVPTPAILSALRSAGVRATMFMTADFVQKNPGLVVQMARDGHEFGNHSATHPDMTRLSDAAVIAELDRLESAVYALTGKSTRPWFRPPYGASNDRLMRLAASRGYYTVMWTADSADWRPEMPAAAIQSRLLTYSTPGSILIQHLGSPQSAELLPQLLRQLKERGAVLGTLSELLGTP